MERNTRIEEELFPFYVLDALTDEERVEVDVYVAANAEARGRLAELALAAADLSAAATTPIAPSPAIKAGLLARIEAESRAAPQSAPTPLPTAPRPERRPAAAPTGPKRSWWDIFGPALAGVAALLLVASAVFVLRYARQVDVLQGQVATLQEISDSLQDRVDGLQDENQTLRRELSARDDLLAQFERPGAVTVAIGDITGQHPEAVAALTMNPTEASATLRVANLPPLHEGTVYQAWLIVGETPISAGTFVVDETGAATHSLAGDLPPQVDAVGISLEPTGGSETPTPDNILLLGTTS